VAGGAEDETVVAWVVLAAVVAEEVDVVPWEQPDNSRDANNSDKMSKTRTFFIYTLL